MQIDIENKEKEKLEERLIAVDSEKGKIEEQLANIFKGELESKIQTLKQLGNIFKEELGSEIQTLKDSDENHRPNIYVDSPIFGRLAFFVVLLDQIKSEFEYDEILREEESSMFSLEELLKLFHYQIKDLQSMSDDFDEYRWGD